ncbi:hypothetical protein [Pseudomonas serbica]
MPNGNTTDVSGQILLQAGQQCSSLNESGAINDWRYRAQYRARRPRRTGRDGAAANA